MSTWAELSRTIDLLRSQPGRPDTALPGEPADRFGFPGTEEQPEPISRLLHSALTLKLQRDQTLMFSFMQAIEGDADLAGEAQRLGIETGLDPELVQQHIPEIRNLQRAYRFQHFEFDKLPPKLQEFLLDDPSFARIAHDDTESLGLLEGLFNLVVNTPVDLYVLAKLGTSLNFGDTRIGFPMSEWELERVNEVMGQASTGELQARKGILGTEAAFDTLRGLDFKQQAVLDRLTADLTLLPHTNSSFISGMFNMIGQYSVTMPTVLTHAAIGGALGTVIPGVGTAAGAWFGGLEGIVSTSAMIEGGNQYLELVAKGVDPVLAAKIALPIGLVSGIFEAAGFGGFVKPVKDLFRKRVAKAITESVAKRWLTPTTTRAVQRSAKGWVSGIGGEVSTEVAQDLIQMFGDSLAGVGPKNAEEVWERIVGTIVETVAAVGIFGTIGPAVGLGVELRVNQASKDTHEVFGNIMKTAAEAKVTGRNPNALEKFYRAVLAGKPANTVYLDGELVQEALREHDISIEAVEAIMPGFTAKLERAVRDGGDVIISMSEYVAKFAPHDIGRVLNQDVRLNQPSSPSVRELAEAKKSPEIRKEMDASIKEAMDRRGKIAAGGKVVYDRVLEEIQATGLLTDAGQQRAAAFLYREIIQALAIREGRTPEEIDAQYKLRVSAERREEGVEPPEARVIPFDDFLAELEITQDQEGRWHWAGHGLKSVDVNEEGFDTEEGARHDAEAQSEGFDFEEQPGEELEQPGEELEQPGEELEQPGVAAQVPAELFSALNDKLKGAMPKKPQSVKKWKKRIHKLHETGRIKIEEIEGTGILDWFDLFDKGATVSAEQVNAFLDSNGIIVRRVQLGSLEETRTEALTEERQKLDALDAERQKLIEERQKLADEKLSLQSELGALDPSGRPTLGDLDAEEAAVQVRQERRAGIATRMQEIVNRAVAVEAEIQILDVEEIRQEEGAAAESLDDLQRRASAMQADITQRLRVIDALDAELPDQGTPAFTGVQAEEARAEVLRLLDEIEPLRRELEALLVQKELPRDKPRGEHSDRVVPGRMKNYRAVLMVLVAETEADLSAEFLPQIRALRRSRVAGEITAKEMEQRSGVLKDRWRAKAQTIKDQTYYHGHFSLNKNVVAFIRLTERVDSEGNRVLFVEEIQSDWGQEGRKKRPKGFRNEANKFAASYRTPDGSVVDVGFGPKAEDAWQNALDAGWSESEMGALGVAVGKLGKGERRAAKAEKIEGLDRGQQQDLKMDEGVWKVTDQNGAIITSVDGVRFNTPEAAIAEANRRLLAVPQESVRGVPGIPLSPLVVETSGWLRLALKQVFLDAVNGGFDKIAFINGPQSAQISNLEHEVEKIEIARIDETSGSLDIRFIFKPGQRRSSVRLTVDKNQKVTQTSDSLFEDKTLDQVVNDVLADRIMEAGLTAGVGAIIDPVGAGPYTVNEIEPQERWYIDVEGEDTVDLDLENEEDADAAAQEMIDDRITEATAELPEEWQVVSGGSVEDTFDSEEDAHQRMDELIDERIEEEVEEKLEEAEADLEADDTTRQTGLFQEVTLTDGQRKAIRAEVEAEVRDDIEVQEIEVELGDEAREDIESSISAFRDEHQEAFEWEILDEDGDRVGDDTFDDESEADVEAEQMNQAAAPLEGVAPGEVAVLESREDLSIMKLGGRGLIQFYGPLEEDMAEAMKTEKEEKGKRKKHAPIVPTTVQKLANTFGGVFEMVDMGPPVEARGDLPSDPRRARPSGPTPRADPASSLGLQVGVTITDEMRQKVGEGLELFQPVGPEGRAGPRGGYDPQRRQINLNKSSDFSSWVHELGHYYMDVILKMALNPNASQGVLDDAAALMEWFGIDSVETWDAMSFEEQKQHHETFATNLEIYYFDGKAPSAALESVFQKIRAWMIVVYQAYTSDNLRAKLSAGFEEQFGIALPEMNAKVRDVFDRMLAAREAIELTEAGRGMLPLFQTQEQSGMSDEMWATYQRASDEYHETAITKLMTRSLRAMQWLSGQSKGKLKQLQRKHDKVRRKTKKEVAARVAQEPVYRAIRFLMTGKFMDPDGTEIDPGYDQRGVAKGHKMDTEQARARTPGAWIPTAPGVPGPAATMEGLQGMTEKGGLNPDLVAQLFGDAFESGEQMIVAILQAKPIGEVIEELTDQRMEAEHSDLVNPKQLRAAIEEALHNPARARFVAAEWRALSGAPGSLRSIIRAARQAARDALAQLPIDQIRTEDFSGAEQRHRKAAAVASMAGDTEGAMRAKRKELLQSMMAAEAAKVVKEIARVVELPSGKLRGKFLKIIGRNKRIGKTRDMDLVRAARIALRAVGLMPPLKTPQQVELRDKALAKIAADYPSLSSGVLWIVDTGVPIAEMSLEQFRSLVLIAEGAWDLALSERTILLGNDKVEVAKIKRKVMEGMLDLAPRKAADRFGARLGEGKTPSYSARAVNRFWHMNAALKRFQHYALFLDQGDPNGPWSTYILRPVFNAVDRLLGKKLEISRLFAAELKALMKGESGALWDTDIQAEFDELPVKSTGKGYVFRGMRELIDVLLDMGNPSNLTKRLVSETWAADPRKTGEELDTSGFDKFVARMWAEGKLTQEHLDFIQFVGQIFKDLRPLAQETQRRVYGYEFVEVVIGTVTLPSGPPGANGTQVVPGWYVPLRYDHQRARQPRIRQEEEIESMAGLEREYAYSNESTLPGRGFTRQRIEGFYDTLHMDLGRRWMAIDEELRFIYLMPVARRVRNIVLDKEVAAVINDYDVEMIRGIFLPWLRATVRQSATAPGLYQGWDWIAKGIRAGTGVAYLGVNLATTIVQFTGAINSLTMVKRRFWFAAMGQVITQPLTSWREAMRDNPRMEVRFLAEGARLHDAVVRASQSPGRRAFTWTQQEGSRAAMWIIRFAQSFIDLITWHGMYQQTLAEQPADMDMNLADKQARRRANDTVERSQGSDRPEVLAAFEVGTPSVRLLVQYLSYSNTVLNQIYGESTVVRRFAKGLSLILLISFMETALRSLVSGEWLGGEDAEGDAPMDRMATRLVENAGRNVTGMLPLFGPMILGFWGREEGNRLNAVPAASAIRTSARGINSIFGWLEGSGDLSVRELGMAATIFTGGIPVMAFSNRLDYLAQVKRGEVDPVNNWDFIRGILSGRASPASER